MTIIIIIIIEASKVAKLRAAHQATRAEHGLCAQHCAAGRAGTRRDVKPPPLSEGRVWSGGEQERAHRENAGQPRVQRAPVAVRWLCPFG